METQRVYLEVEIEFLYINKINFTRKDSVRIQLH